MNDILTGKGYHRHDDSLVWIRFLAISNARRRSVAFVNGHLSFLVGCKMELGRRLAISDRIVLVSRALANAPCFAAYRVTDSAIQFIVGLSGAYNARWLV